VPPLMLGSYGLGFAWTALGRGLLVFDDHPGQLYRVWHAITIGLWPWRLNAGWWAGYAELQFYPPGLAYAGAALHGATLGAVDASTAYQWLLWLIFLLPGLSTYLLLARVLKNPWLALPGAFLALTLSAGSRSGVEEGMRWGLVASRLGWGVLPLLALSLHCWRTRRAPPLHAAPLIAGIILLHPAHAPAAIALVGLAAWHGPGPRLPRLRDGALLAAASAGLAGFWLLPLAVHLQMALPLAWGDTSLSALVGSVARYPLLLGLLASSALGWWMRRRSTSPSDRWLSGWAPVAGALIIVDALVVQPLGMRWLPADRLLDSFLLALIVGASLALAIVRRRWPRIPAPVLAALSICACLLLSAAGSGDEPALSLWPAPWANEWPKYNVISRRLRLPELWEALRHAPPGRVLFIRSGIPLEYRPDWRRPHSHLTALTPLFAGREIVNGTFTHPSPIAGLVYTGSASNRPITMLVEQRDGQTLFGTPLGAIDPRGFDALIDRLLVSTVVAQDEDERHLDALARNPRFDGPARVGPFLMFTSRRAWPTPESIGTQRWRITVPPHRAGWVSTGTAYSPLWRVRADGRLLATRHDELGLLEVEVPSGDALVLELTHEPGPAEWSGVALSGACALALLIVGYRRRRRRPEPPDVRSRPVREKRWARASREPARSGVRRSTSSAACEL
jgi:hypothetical protein